MNTKTKVVLSAALSAAVAGMVKAVQDEGTARDAAEAAVTKAAANAWEACRNVIHGILTRPAKNGTQKAKRFEDARDVLAVFRDTCKTEGEKAERMKRGTQYASDLNRAVKAADAGLSIPAALWKATRKEWTEAEFWRENGILAASGSKKGTKKGPAARSEEGEEGSVSAAALKADKPLSEFMTALAVLKGQFRAVALKEATEAARRQAKLQTAATGSDGRVAVA